MRKAIKKGCAITLASTVIIIGILIYRLFNKPINFEKLVLTDLNEEQIDFHELYKDKLTLVNFWATWCKPCVAEMPLLDSLQHNLDKRIWQVVLISDESFEKITSFKQKKGYSMTFLKKESDNNSIGIAVLPKTIVINGRGKIIYEKTGELSKSLPVLLAELQSLENQINN